MHIVVISLKHRTDRRAHMQKVIQEYFPFAESSLFLTAVPGGASGCTMSHIHAISYLMNKISKDNHCIVLEDDFDPNNTFSEQDLMVLQADVLMLQANLQDYTPINRNLSKVHISLSSAAYVFRKDYGKKLLANLTSSWNENRPLDVGFTQLQQRDNWYAKILGRQKPGYSDIQKRHVNYGC